MSVAEAEKIISGYDITTPVATNTHPLWDVLGMAVCRFSPELSGRFQQLITRDNKIVVIKDKRRTGRSTFLLFALWEDLRRIPNPENKVIDIVFFCPDPERAAFAQKTWDNIKEVMIPDRYAKSKNMVRFDTIVSEDETTLGYNGNLAENVLSLFYVDDARFMISQSHLGDSGVVPSHFEQMKQITRVIA